MSKFWSGFVRDLDPYVPGEQPKNTQFIKLNTNENPYPPAPGVMEAIHAAATDSLRLYPDPDSRQLKEAIAAGYDVAVEQVFVGNSSDEVLAHVFHALFKQPEPLLFPDITYGFYPTYARLYDIDSVKIPLTGDFQIRVDDYFRPNGGIIFPNPNAPTGTFLPLAEIERLLQNNTGSAVVIDEAYVDFGGQSAVSLIDRYPNLLVVQTLSKSRSLAGLRVGFAIGHTELIEGIERIKNSFNSYPLDRLAIAGAAAALEDTTYFEATRIAIIASREKLSDGLKDLGFEVLPSAANFIFTRHPAHNAAQLAAALRQQNILVRHFRQPRIEQFLRISIGTPEECAAVLNALRSIVG